MAIRSTYYLDGDTLATATAVYTDANLTVCAPDGFYSDGVISREQSGCQLLPVIECPLCAGDCSLSPITLVGTSGVYNARFDMGNTVADTGAIVIDFQFGNVPDGVIVEYNGQTYNELSSEVVGFLAAPAGQPTYVGKIADDCGIAGTTQDLEVYEYNGSNYLNTGTTESVSISPNQVKTTLAAPLRCVMVIPKPNALPEELDVKVIAACPQASFIYTVRCPANLPSFEMIPTPALTLQAACELTPVGYIPFFHALVNGNATDIGLYDFVFSNPDAHPYQGSKVSSIFSIPSGETRFFRFRDGAYPAGAVVEIDSNSVIVSIQTCVA